MHDLTVDPVNHVAYQTLHSIHHAEHTGSPEEEELAILRGNPNRAEPEHHFQGRWLAEVDVNPDSPTFKQVTYIDLSNGQNVIDVPNSDDVVPGSSFESRYIHAHWVAVDPARGSVVVTGEHTGNLGVVDQGTRQLEQVVAISTRFSKAVTYHHRLSIYPVTVMTIPVLVISLNRRKCQNPMYMAFRSIRSRALLMLATKARKNASSSR
jgi:hypothetical protein